MFPMVMLLFTVHNNGHLVAMATTCELWMDAVDTFDFCTFFFDNLLVFIKLYKFQPSNTAPPFCDHINFATLHLFTHVYSYVHDSEL